MSGNKFLWAFIILSLIAESSKSRQFFHCFSVAAYSVSIMEESVPKKTGETSCGVAMCANYGRRAGSEDVSYHYFPKTEALRYAWTKACRRGNLDGTAWLVTYSRTICSKHFLLEDCKSVAKFGKSMERKLLRPDAVPTVFECLPLHLRHPAVNVLHRWIASCSRKNF